VTVGRLLALSALVAVCDQLTKWIVWTHFRLGETRPALGTLFSWTYCHNTGGAFSILAGSRWFFLLAGTVISLFLIRSLPRVAQGHPAPALAHALILGGAIGNMIDRSLYGYVVDFIDFHWWPVFNVADSAITVGIALLAISMMLGKDEISRPGD
jgi:signal peptidase II